MDGGVDPDGGESPSRSTRRAAGDAMHTWRPPLSIEWYGNVADCPYYLKPKPSSEEGGGGGARLRLCYSFPIYILISLIVY